MRKQRVTRKNPRKSIKQRKVTRMRRNTHVALPRFHSQVLSTSTSCVNGQGIKQSVYIKNGEGRLQIKEINPNAEKTRIVSRPLTKFEVKNIIA